jgi:hypothetical protein
VARSINSVIDSLNFFVESRNAGNIFNVVTTATGGATSADLQNTAQRGGLFFITFASVTVTACTLALNINAKDVQSGTYFPYIRVSCDGVSVGGPLQNMALVYVGAVTQTSVVPGTVQTVSMPLPGTFQVVSSLTISNTTATMSGTVSYSVDYGKIL